MLAQHQFDQVVQSLVLPHQAADVKRLQQPVRARFVKYVELLPFTIKLKTAATARAANQHTPTRVEEGLSRGEHKLFVLREVLLDEDVDDLGLGQGVLPFRENVVFKSLCLSFLFLVGSLHDGATSTDASELLLETLNDVRVETVQSLQGGTCGRVRFRSEGFWSLRCL